MRVLALESATERPSVALVDGEHVLCVHEAGRDATRSETILPAVAALLAEAGVAFAALDAFAVGIGPGSFTGLRVGLATLKGMAFGDERPAVAVPTLEAVAREAGDPYDRAVIAALDARRGEVYAAGYGPAPGEALVPEGLYRPEQLAAALPAGIRSGRLVGDGAGLLATALPGFQTLPATPCAGHVGVLGARRLAAGEGVPAAQLTPRYVRRAEAEVKRLGLAVEPPAG